MVDDRRGTRFIGRATERATLELAFQAATVGASRTVIVAGEAGIGKTRLVEVFADSARRRGARVLWGACLEYGAGALPYFPFVSALRTLTRSTEPARLPALLGPGRAELARLLPELGPVAGTATGPDDAQAQARLFELVLGVIERMARDGPVLVVIEDIQWADTSTRDLLLFLVTTLLTGKVLFVVTARSEDLHHRHPILPFLAELERDDWVDRIELAPLDRAEVAAQFEDLTGMHPPPEDVDRLLARSDGNPFFVEQLASIGSHLIDGDLPPRLRDVLAARIGILSDDGQMVLRAASAAGRRLDDRLLAEVLEQPDAIVASALHEVVEQGILVPADDDSDPATAPGHAFRHSLLREVVYEGLFAGERMRLHAAFARCLGRQTDRPPPAAELAFHWDAARVFDLALEKHVEAGGEADRVFAHAEALRHYARALELWGVVEEPERVAGGDRTRVIQLAAEAAVQAGEYDRAVELGRKAVAAIDASADPVRAGLANERLRWFLWEAGDRVAAEEVVRAALELLPTEPPSVARARATAHLAGILLFGGRWDLARTKAAEAVAMARSIGDSSVEAFGLGVRGLAGAFLGDAEAGVADLRAALAIAIALDSTDGLVLGYANLSVLLDRIGRSQEALAAAMEGYDHAAARGLARTYGGVMLGHAAKVLIDLGRWQEADRLTAEGLDRGAPGRAGVWLRINRGRLETRRGDTTAAADHLAQARRLDVAVRGTEFRTALLTAEAELALAAGRPQDVRSISDEGLAVARAGGLPEPGLAWLAALALRAEADVAEDSRAKRDDVAGEEAADRAADVMNAMDEVSQRMPALATAAGLRGAGIAALCHGEVARLVGQPDPAPWVEAAAAWESLDRPYPSAYSRYREAEALLSTRGSRSSAESALRRSHEIVSRLGAQPLMAQIELLARQANINLGGASPLAPLTSTDERSHGLTPREMEVLRLVAGGWTNQQIADELFITRKTASVHVSNIMGKLGVDSRVEAAAIAFRLGIGADAPLPPDRVA